MQVRVVDRGKPGIRGYQGVVVRTVTIPDYCPVCAGPRGNPYRYRFHEDGDWYECDRWENPCGHVDTYEAILRADERHAEAHRDLAYRSGW